MNQFKMCARDIVKAVTTINVRVWLIYILEEEMITNLSHVQVCQGRLLGLE